MQTIRAFFSRQIWLWMQRGLALIDGSALFMIVPALLWMHGRDAPLVMSILEWTVLFAILAGLSVVISRVTFPHLNLELFLKNALNGSVSCAIVVAGVLVFVAWTMQTVAMWARPIGSATGG